MRPVPGSNAGHTANLLALYQEAVVAEDSDRLSALLAPAAALGQPQPPAVLRQDPPGAVADLAVLQATLRTTFQQATVTALAIPPETVVVARTRAVSPFWRLKAPSTR